MSYTITDLITRAATVCTTLGYTMNKNNVGGTDVADLGNQQDFGRGQTQYTSGTLLVISEQFNVKTNIDNNYTDEYTLLIGIHTRRDESDNLSKAASCQNARNKLELFLNSFCQRGVVDDMRIPRDINCNASGLADRWSLAEITIKVRVTNCP